MHGIVIAVLIVLEIRACLTHFNSSRADDRRSGTKSLVTDGEQAVGRPHDVDQPLARE
jgi:hypothetical protein